MQTRNLEEFNGVYKNKVGLILGSGTSLFQHLEFLKKVPNNYISIAVNSAYVGCPDADFFISDDWEVKKWDYFTTTLRNSDKTNVLLYENKLKDVVEWFGNRSVLFRHRKGYHLSDQYSHSDKSLHIQQCRSSLGSAIGVAKIMCLNPIILLGVDCYRDCNYRWFWQYPEFPNKPKRIDGRNPDKYVYRKSSQTDNDLVEILQYWDKEGSKILEKCDVYNASPKSFLTVFPKINFQDFVSNRIF